MKINEIGKPHIYGFAFGNSLYVVRGDVRKVTTFHELIRLATFLMDLTDVKMLKHRFPEKSSASYAVGCSKMFTGLPEMSLQDLIAVEHRVSQLRGHKCLSN